MKKKDILAKPTIFKIDDMHIYTVYGIQRQINIKDFKKLEKII